MTRILNLAESHLQPLAATCSKQPLAATWAATCSHLSSYLQPLAPKHIFLWLLFLFFSWGKPLKRANMLILCVNQVTMSCFTAVHRLDHGLEPLIGNQRASKKCVVLCWAQPPAFQYRPLSLQVHVRKRVLAARRVRSRLLENLCSADRLDSDSVSQQETLHCWAMRRRWPSCKYSSNTATFMLHVPSP